MPVNSQHKQLTENRGKWDKIRDCVAGSDQVKSKKEKYLPKPNPEDDSPENEARFNAYITRANFVNFTGMTLDGMLGMVFRVDPQIELEAVLEYLKTNANGSGVTLDQMARGLVSNLLQTGRHGLLVDYPQAEPGLTKAQVDALNLRANIKGYRAERVINWRTETVGGETVLSLVVLEEEVEVVQPDGFGSDSKTQFRVLSLVDGLYTQAVYDEDGVLVGEIMEPKKADGSLWRRIPFVFVGSTNNDAECDKAPLYDIAELNISHYRNSADYEESSFIVGQPTPVLGGLTQGWVDTVMKKGVMLGSRRAILLPEGGKSSLLQASENQMPSKGMEMKEAQMIKIGARIIQDASGQETAEAAKIRFGGQNSKLGIIVGNVEAALNECIMWAAEFMGGSGENEVTLNREFYDKSIDPQLVIASIQLLDRGVIATSDMRQKLRDSGLISSDREDEEIDAEVEENGGSGGAML